jgi:ABC-type transport system substrate-binding protein
MMALSRRRFLRTAALASVGLATLPLAGCGGQSGPVSSVPSDTVRVAYSALLPNLDPHAWSTATGPRTLAPMFDALTFIQSDGKLRPALAIAWSQLDRLTWQFRLRVDDAKFHNGELFGPESVQVTFDRLRGSRLPVARLAAAVQRVDVVDPATVNLVTAQPDPDLPRWVSAVYMLPARYYGQAGESGFASQPVGTGFWQLDDFQPGSHLHLAQFRDSCRGARGGDSAPVLKRLELDVLADANARGQALAGLQFDVATELTASQAASLKAAGFSLQTTNLGPLNQSDQGWQTKAFGASLAPGIDILGTAANVKGATTLPNGSWWFDRVTKTELQRIAVAGGA